MPTERQYLLTVQVQNLDRLAAFFSHLPEKKQQRAQLLYEGLRNFLISQIEQENQ